MTQFIMMFGFNHVYRHLSKLHIPIDSHIIINCVIWSIMLCLIVQSFLTQQSTLFLFTINEWNINIDLIGLIIPFIFSVYLLFNNKIKITELVFGIIAVCIMAYFVTIPIPEKGIISPFPFSLLPALTGAWLSFILYDNNQRMKRLTFSYTVSMFGVFLGADIFHLPSLLFSQTNVLMKAIIGGAGMHDMIFISGIISCLFILSHSSILSIYQTFIQYKKKSTIPIS